MDPPARTPWSTPATVAGFIQALPNARLIQFARDEIREVGRALRVLDIGCGAGRNAVPLAQLGCRVFGIDLSEAMLTAAVQRAREHHLEGSLHVALAAMNQIPARNESADFVVAHGIWNLARSGEEFRQGVREAARVATPGARLFVFTFSRSTLPTSSEPILGESYVFDQFSGQPQCFLTRDQLLSELGAAGFTPSPDIPPRELNRPPPGALLSTGAPVIYEGVFHRATG